MSPTLAHEGLLAAWYLETPLADQAMKHGRSLGSLRIVSLH